MKKDIDQLFREFIFECQYSTKISKGTLRGYHHTYSLFKKLIPDMSLEMLTSTTITYFFSLLQNRTRIIGKGIPKTGIKKSTVATYWNKLNSFFDWLLRKNHIHSNPFRELRFPSPAYEDKKFLKKEEIEKILTAIYVHHNNNIFLLKRNLAIFHLLLFCGLRREELMQLQIRDFDFDRKTVTVRADTSKSKRDRQLPLHSSVLMHLKDYLAARKTKTCPYLLVSSTRDAPFTNEGLKHLVIRLKRLAGVSFHLHQFRHTFAVNFLKSSNNIAKLKQLLGHKSIVLTMVYLRCLPVDEMREDIEIMSIDRLI
jgi:site-specific recombinase XerD